MADGMIGYGSTVRVGRSVGGGTPTFTALAFVGDLEMPDETIDKIDVTHMQSPGRRKQFITGLIDGGEIGIPMNYIPESPTDNLLNEIKASGEDVILEITLTSTGTPEKYGAILIGYARTAPVNDKMTATATFALNEVIDD